LGGREFLGLVVLSPNPAGDLAVVSDEGGGKPQDPLASTIVPPRPLPGEQ
jgi:hypothetical protein